MMVQTVSADKKTFVIRKGAEDDIRVGMESLFSNKNASIKARAIKTTRFFSLWQMREKNSFFPFKKKQYIIFNRDLDVLWYSIPTVKTAFTAKKVWQPKNYWTFKTGFSFTLSESISSIAAENRALRTNLQFAVMWHKEIREKSIDWGIGLRYDRETAQTTTPVIVTIPSIRTMLATDFTVHFPHYKNTKNNFYGVFGIAGGVSSTVIDTDTISGYALVFPQVTLGFSKQLGKSKAMLFEVTTEVVSTYENFSDGDLQTAHMLNTKFNLGLKF